MAQTFESVKPPSLCPPPAMYENWVIGASLMSLLWFSLLEVRGKRRYGMAR